MFAQFFKNRTIRGFYLPCVAALLSLIASIIYISGYMGSSYYNILPFLFPLIGAVLFFGLIFFKLTERFAALVNEIFTFLGFLFFIRYVYLYLSTVFYDGISLQAIANISPVFTCVLLFELIAIVLANFGLYIAPRKEEKEVA